MRYRYGDPEDKHIYVRQVLNSVYVNSELRIMTLVCAQVKAKEINNVAKLTLKLPEIQVFFLFCFYLNFIITFTESIHRHKAKHQT